MFQVYVLQSFRLDKAKPFEYGINNILTGPY